MVKTKQFTHIIKSSNLGNLYNKANLKVKAADGLSEPSPVSQRVLQGEVMSQLLFGLFIADIEEFLYSKGIKEVSLNHYLEIIMMAFADDMVFLAGSTVWLIMILFMCFTIKCLTK